MYAYMCYNMRKVDAYVYVSLYAYVCIYVCTSAYVYMHVFMCTTVHVCIRMWMLDQHGEDASKPMHHVCMHVCMHACMHACMCACVHVCMCACMHVCHWFACRAKMHANQWTAKSNCPMHTSMVWVELWIVIRAAHRWKILPARATRT